MAQHRQARERGARPEKRAPATLLEREDELATVEALLGHAAAGHGSVLLIEGPAGIGKTELLGQARELATDREMEALSARG